MPDDVFDLVVMGAGPAGENAALTSALLGKRVAVVERAGYPGGAAVNTGTVPSKTLRETALALSGFRSRRLHGVDLSLRRGATVDDFLRHERSVKTGERSDIQQLLDKYGVTTFHGTASFAGPNQVKVVPAQGDAYILKADKICIAIGSVPVHPAGIPFEHNQVHDSDQLLDIHEVPESIAIVGAGVIGSEYACMFAMLGVKTYLIDGRTQLLPFLDQEISKALEKCMQELGVQFIWGANVEQCPYPSTEGVQLCLSNGQSLKVHHVLFCAGRMSRTDQLNCEAAGVVLCDKGRVAVNEHYQTSVPNIYAVGDVIGYPALASTSAEQARVAACHMFEAHFQLQVSPVLPTGIYTIPEVSAAGETEQNLQSKKIPYIVGFARYIDTPRGKIIGDTDGFMKLLFHAESMQLLGVHVIGELASEILHVGIMALLQHAHADLFLKTCFNYPTLGELYKLATYDAYKKKWNRNKSE